MLQKVTHTTLSKIEIQTPTFAQLTSLAIGRVASFKVKGFYSSDNIEEDVSSQIVWSSKSPLLSAIYPISNGYIRASGVGNTSLLATLFDITDKIEFEIKKSEIKKVKIDIEEVVMQM